MMPRISFAVALVLLLVASGCATGKPAPATTPMAKVTDGLTFQFGMGGQGCGIPQTATACTADHKFDPGEPAVMVKVKPFAIDVHEVTVEQYRYCQEFGVCSLPAGDNGPSGVPDYYTNKTYNNRPAVLVTWYQAEQFCEFMGKRLPTEFEWERVAGGPAQSTADKRLYSFVDKLGPDAAIPSPCQKNVNIQGCNSGLTDTRDVMSSTDDVVSVGSSQVWDVSGNVSEWTASDDDVAPSAAFGLALRCAGSFFMFFLAFLWLDDSLDVDENPSSSLLLVSVLRSSPSASRCSAAISVAACSR